MTHHTPLYPTLNFHKTCTPHTTIYLTFNFHKTHNTQPLTLPSTFTRHTTQNVLPYFEFSQCPPYTGSYPTHNFYKKPHIQHFTLHSIFTRSTLLSIFTRPTTKTFYPFNFCLSCGWFLLLLYKIYHSQPFTLQSTALLFAAG